MSAARNGSVVPASYEAFVESGGLANCETVIGAGALAWNARVRERMVLDAVAALHPRLAVFIAEKFACEVCMNPKHVAHKPGVVWCDHKDPLAYFVPSDKVEAIAESLRASDEQNERYRAALERIIENADEVLNPTDGD